MHLSKIQFKINQATNLRICFSFWGNLCELQNLFWIFFKILFSGEFSEFGNLGRKFFILSVYQSRSPQKMWNRSFWHQLYKKRLYLYESLPFSVSLSQDLGLERSSLTVPWDSPSTYFANSRCPMLCTDNISRTLKRTQSIVLSGIS